MVNFSIYLNRRVFVMLTGNRKKKIGVNNDKTRLVNCNNLRTDIQTMQNYNKGTSRVITKTCQYNFEPLKPHFYTVKLEFTRVYIIFLIFARIQTLWVLVRIALVTLGYSFEPHHRGGSKVYPQFNFLLAEIRKISEFSFLTIFSFWRWNFLYIWIGVFL